MARVNERRLSELHHGKWTVRCRALKALLKLDTKTLLDYAGRVTQLLDDENWQVRHAALEVLAKLQAVACSTQAVLLSLTDGHVEVRRAALRALTNLPPEGLDQCAKVIVARLGDKERFVRKHALDVMSKLTHTCLAEYSGPVSWRLIDDDGGVRKAAVYTLRRLIMEDLQLLLSSQEQRPEIRPLREEAASSGAMPAGDQEQEERVVTQTPKEEEEEDACEDGIREAKVELAADDTDDVETEDHEHVNVQHESGAVSTPRSSASPSSANQTFELGAERASEASPPQQSARNQTVSTPTLRRDVVNALCTLFQYGTQALRPVVSAFVNVDPEALDQAFAIVAEQSVCSTLLHHAAEHACLPVVKFLVTKRYTLLHAKNSASDTPLHLAAREGHMDVCRVLVSAGALTKVKNFRKLTPADLASQQGHTAVFSFLESRQNLTTVRGGTGNALSVALEDQRPIIKVEWYKIALPGVAGSLGAIHSLLAITVGGPEESHTYVIEKAAVARAEGSQDDQELSKNGVHVSHWLDVVPNVEHDPMYVLDLPEIQNNTGTPDFCMRVLRDIAVNLGPYNVATCNCHHAALEVYNACAVESSRVPRIPNSLLVLGARLLQGVGVDVGTSESAVSRSESRSTSVQSGPGLSTAVSVSTSTRTPTLELPTAHPCHPTEPTSDSETFLAF
mmetsp:Transcript_91406/g.167748  ORF Transcript_91406/g.167748 Transcript_91406/m.167748 type:complete len:678 (-) Transcript_91406:96-2129(-)